MSWRKYFTPIPTGSEMSPISGLQNSTKAGPARTNYSSYLPDVYTGSPNRIERYQQYEVMDSDPEVNAALDILAEFCTQKLKDGKSPFTVKWRSKASNSEVRILSEYLQQWNKLQQFDTRIFRIVRNVYKYGDAFFIRDPETQKWSWVDPSKIVKVIVNESDGKKPEQYVIKDLAPNFENLVVTQITPNINPRQSNGGMTSGAGYMGSQSSQRGSSGPYPSSSSGSRFGLSETEYAIDAEHVVHISLSEGLDNNYPFGNSLLENIYKVYKQKELLEDAVLIYRIQRAPERRVFHIDVGNMPSHMAMSFVERVKNEIHQRRIPSQSGGGCFSMDTKVPLLDGRILTLSELATEYDNGVENWAYSCNPETREMVPGLITWAGVTQKSAQVLEIILDNDEKIICTPEHKYPIVGKGKVEAKDIIVNEDSLISFNTRLYSINEKNNESDPQYHQYFEHTSNKWVFTHRKIANFFKDKNQHNELVYSQKVTGKKSVIHHKDFNKYNNTPSNLWFMNGYDHFLLHSEQYGNYFNNLSDTDKKKIIDKGRLTKLKQTKEEREKIFSKISAGNKTAWDRMKTDTDRFEARKSQLLKNLTFINEPWQNQKLKVNERMYEILIETISTSKFTKSEICNFLSNDKEFMTIYTDLNSPEEKKICKLSNHISKTTINNIVEQFGFSSWMKFLKENGRNKTQPVRKLKWDISMLKILVDVVNENNIQYKSDAYEYISKNNEFLTIFKQLNNNIKGNSNINNFSKNTFNVFLYDMGYGSWKEFVHNKKEFNHKVKSIRYVKEPIEVGTLTIDGKEIHHDYHTFAIEQGVYTYNSNVIDSAYNPLCLDLATRIPLLDGRTLTLQELINEFEAGKENWAYSCDPETGKIVPGVINWAGITRRNTEVIKLTFDNGETLICTPDHKIPVFGKGIIEANDLTESDSLISLIRIKYENNEKIYDHHSARYIDTKNMVGLYFKELSKHQEFTYDITDIEPKETILHRDFNISNNDPRNLWFMSKDDKELYDSAQQNQYYGNNKLHPFGAKNVISIESVSNRDTGTITIDGTERWHNYHTFAIDSGVFVKNSINEDYFFPMTADGRGSKVDVLPGGCFAMDTKVSLLDGRELSIKEIEEEMKTGKTLWSYSCEPLTGKIVPGLITWAGVTQKSAQVMKITLDNGESIICTPCHKFPTYEEPFRRAKDFKIGDSIIPLYRRKETIIGSNIYEEYFDNADKTWKFTHRMVSDFLKDTEVKYEIYNESVSNGEYEVRHHKDFNRYNNDPSNLCFMSWDDHIAYHRGHSSTKMKLLKENNPDLYQEICDKISKGLKNSWNNLTDEEYENRCNLIISQTWKNYSEEEYNSVCEKIGVGIKTYVANLSEDDREIRATRSRNAFKLGNKQFNHLMDTDPEFRKQVLDKRSLYWTDDNRQIRSEFMTEQNKEFWSGEAGEIRRSKQKSLQSVSYSHDMLKAVIDLVKGKTTHECTLKDVINELNNNDELLSELHELNKFKKVKNWTINDGFTATGMVQLVKQFGYASWKDFRVKESIHNHRIIAIEYLDDEIEVGTLTIDGDEKYHNYHSFALSVGVFGKNSNLGEIDDLKYFTNKLFRGLRIPSSYLPTGADDSQASFNDGRVGTAYIQELRFNKYCERLQWLMTDTFDTEFKLFMNASGVNIDSNLFEINFNPPMNFASTRQSALDSERINTFNTIQQIPFISNRFALKRFLGLSDDELADNERLWAEENGKGLPNHTDSAGEMRSAGLSAAGIEGDLGMAGDLSAPGDMAGEMGDDMGGIPPVASAPTTPPSV